MDERQFYTQIFGIAAPWTVTDVKLDVKGEEVIVHVAADAGAEPNPANLSKPAHIATFEVLRASSLRTGRAWAIKETAISLWNYVSRGHANNAWRRWISWARRSKLEPVKRVAAMIREHLYGIVTAIVTRTTNAAAESVNARIQWIKRMACGFRSRDRFRNAIYFHLGGLDLYPASCTLTHTKA